MQQCNNVILSTAYFPPVQYFSKILNYDSVIIEQHENFSKQSYRNRCNILSPNGKQTLSIPVEKISGSKQLIKNIRIDYKNDWPGIHFKSLQTAYLSSPFYEFYIDAFKPFFEKKYKFLFDLNLEIIQTILSEIQIAKQPELSKQYNASYNFPDFRNIIHPKEKFQTEDRTFKPIKYAQVFSDKYGFIANLSVLDLLFNEGPNTENILKQTFQLQ